MRFAPLPIAAGAIAALALTAACTPAEDEAVDATAADEAEEAAVGARAGVETRETPAPAPPAVVDPEVTIPTPPVEMERVPETGDAATTRADGDGLEVETANR